MVLYPFGALDKILAENEVASVHFAQTKDLAIQIEESWKLAETGGLAFAPIHAFCNKIEILAIDYLIVRHIFRCTFAAQRPHFREMRLIIHSWMLRF